MTKEGSKNLEKLMTREKVLQIIANSFIDRDLAIAVIDEIRMILDPENEDTNFNKLFFIKKAIEKVPVNL